MKQKQTSSIWLAIGFISLFLPGFLLVQSAQDGFNPSYIIFGIIAVISLWGGIVILGWRKIHADEHIKENLSEILESNEMLFHAVQSTLNGVVIVDAHDINLPIIFVNQGFTKITGYHPVDVLGCGPNFLHGADTDSKAKEKIRKAIRDKKPIVHEILNFRKDSTPFWNELHLSPVIIRGDLRYWIAIQNDVTARRTNAETTNYLAHNCQLVELPNRTDFSKRIVGFLHDAESTESTDELALMYLDLDLFKEVNDTFGHQTGDKVLQEVANRLKEAMRPNDYVARLGGDEFAVILPHVRNRRVIEDICARIIENINLPFDINGHLFHIGCSIGIAIAPADSMDPYELQKFADLALYHSKGELGRNAWCFYDHKMMHKVVNRHKIATEMREAFKSKAMEPWFMPIVSPGHGKVRGAEALVRWRLPDGSIRMPGQFIEIAEQDPQLNLMLTEYMVNETIEIISKWDWSALRIQYVSINFPAERIKDSGFIRKFINLVKNKMDDPGRIKVEITETALVDNFDIAQDSIAKMRQAGIMTYMDDFGSGYSSLSYLWQLDVEGVKIDQKFTQRLSEVKTQHIFQGIVDLCQRMNYLIIVEGVEDQVTVDKIVTSAHHAQGFHWSPALPEKEFLTFVQLHRDGYKTIDNSIGSAYK